MNKSYKLKGGPLDGDVIFCSCKRGAVYVESHGEEKKRYKYIVNCDIAVYDSCEDINFNVMKVK